MDIGEQVLSGISTMEFIYAMERLKINTFIFSISAFPIAPSQRFPATIPSELIIRPFVEVFIRFDRGACIILKEVPVPERFGVPVFSNGRAVSTDTNLLLHNPHHRIGGGSPGRCIRSFGEYARRG